MIYECPHTGVRLDPLAAKRAIVLAAKGRFNEAVYDSQSSDPVTAATGQTVLVAVARAVFGLKPLETEDSVALAALTGLTRWLKVKKEKGPLGQTERPCSGCPER